MAKAKVLRANGAPRWLVGKTGEVVKTHEDGSVDLTFSAEDCRTTVFRTWSFENHQVEMLPDSE